MAKIQIRRCSFYRKNAAQNVDGHATGGEVSMNVLPHFVLLQGYHPNILRQGLGNLLEGFESGAPDANVVAG